MITFDKGENSIKLAAWYRDINLTTEELNKYDGMITKECKKYLIGKTCEREKNNRDVEERVIDVYARLGREFGYTGASVKNLVTYARAVDHFYRIAPDIAAAILAGRTRLAYKNVIALAKMEIPDIHIIMERLAHEKTPIKSIFKEQKERPKPKKKRGRPRRNFLDPPRTSVKDTPPYDPDSQVMALIYTVPSWINSIDSTFMNADFRRTTRAARSKLIKELTELKDIVDVMISMLSDEK